MRRTIFTLFLLCLGNAIFSQVKYSIEGTTGKDLEGEKVYLILVEEDNRFADSTLVVNGKFHFEGELIRPCWACTKIMQTKVEPAFIILENGNIRLHIEKEKQIQCEGTPTNEAFSKFFNTFELRSKEQGKIRKAIIDSTSIDKETKKKLILACEEESIKEKKVLIKQFINENLDNIAPAFWIRLLSPIFSSEELEEILAKASPVLKENRFIKNIVDLQPGKRFIDVNLESKDDKKLKLSDIAGKGNYLLIDVWASWCGGCKAGLPKVEAAGKKYSSKGLKVVSISIDKNKNDWKKALERLNLPWQQVHADYSFVNTYGINLIPALILIGPDGTIIKQNFKIEDLDSLIGSTN